MSRSMNSECSRRLFLKYAGLGTPSILLYGMLACNSNTKYPNILIAISDDQSYPHCSAFGCKFIQTPAFDRVAKEGILFNNAFVTSAGCAPSRASLVLGRYPWQNEHAGNHSAIWPNKFVPFPDTEEIMSDLLDYAVEIEWFDHHLEKIISVLEENNELDNTILLVTSDNGMAFPSAKANCYEYGIHVPLAIGWGNKIFGGRVVDDLVSLVDVYSTLFDILNYPLPKEFPVAGKSFANILFTDKQGKNDSMRKAVFASRERHSCSRWQNSGYPQRAVRTDQYLYIWNCRPERWPAGKPEKFDDQGNRLTAFQDVDRADRHERIANAIFIDAILKSTIKVFSQQVDISDIEYRCRQFQEYDAPYVIHSLKKAPDYNINTVVYSHRMIYNTSQLFDDPERFTKLINTMDNVCKKYDKDFIVRAFLYEPEQLAWFSEGLKRVNPGVMLQAKCMPHDFSPNYLHNPIIGQFPDREMIIEFSPSEGFYGASTMPFTSPEYFEWRWRYDTAQPGVVGYNARLDQSVDALNNPQEIDLYALYRFAEDKNLGAKDVWKEWTQLRYNEKDESMALIHQALGYLEKAEPFLKEKDYKHLVRWLNIAERDVYLIKMWTEAFFGYKVLAEGHKVPGLRQRVERAADALMLQAKASAIDPLPQSEDVIRRCAQDIKMFLQMPVPVYQSFVRQLDQEMGGFEHLDKDCVISRESADGEPVFKFYLEGGETDKEMVLEINEDGLLRKKSVSRLMSQLPGSVRNSIKQNIGKDLIFNNN